MNYEVLLACSERVLGRNRFFFIKSGSNVCLYKEIHYVVTYYKRKKRKTTEFNSQLYWETTRKKHKMKREIETKEGERICRK